MGTVKWDELKNEWLKVNRGVGFEELILSRYLKTRNSKKQGQQIMLFEYKDYVWAVPCLIREHETILKTLYPSRKYDKLYRKGLL